jgi:hypothetical protein
VERLAGLPDATEALRASTFATGFEFRPAEAFSRELDPFRGANFPAFAFKRMDLVPVDDRFAAFFIAFTFCLAFVAMSRAEL